MSSKPDQSRPDTSVKSQVVHKGSETLKKRSVLSSLSSLSNNDFAGHLRAPDVDISRLNLTL
jgi:hypothetical protein